MREGGAAGQEKPLKEMKKGIAHLIIYVGAAVVSVLSVVQVQEGILPQAVGIIVYVLAAGLLASACICLYQDLRKGIIQRIVLSIKKTSFPAS